MDSQLLGIVTLLRSALKDEAQVLPEDFNWDAAVRILYEHHLVGLAIRGAARCGVSRSNPVIRQLTARFCKDVAVSRQQMQQLDEVYALFEAHGIEYMPVKGAILKPLYPQTELRPMGDADILIRQEQYEKIREILPALGLKEILESDHELIWQGRDLTMELHKRLIPSYNKDYYAYYGDGWRFAQRAGQSSACHMRPEDHFIYLLVHFAKHYRDGSISAKNICDFWVCRRAYPDMDKIYICTELEKLKLLDFYRNVLDLLDTWFEGAAPTEAVERLTHTAFHGGIYSFEESQQASSVIRIMKETSSFSGSKRKWLKNKLFPPMETLAQRYPVLRKYPLLLPLCWIARWAETLFLRPDRIKKSLTSSRGVMNMDRERIAEYEAQLRAVGLDFSLPE